MKTSLHRIVTEDHLELVGLLYEPDTATNKVLVHIHGMGGNFYENRFCDVIAKTLTDKGIAFFVFNNRGCEYFKDFVKVPELQSQPHNKKTFVRIGSAYEKFEECILDIKAAIDTVSQAGFKQIHLSGHSLGCPKITYYMTETRDQRISSLMFLSPADMLGLERANPERFKKDSEEAMKMVQNGKGSELLSQQVWDEYPLTALTFLGLFADDAKAGIFNLYNPQDKLEAFAQITQPLCVVMGRKDDALTVPIEEMMERVSQAAKNSTRVETKILGEATHGYEGFEDQLAETVLAWISSNN